VHVAFAQALDELLPPRSRVDAGSDLGVQCDRAVQKECGDVSALEAACFRLILERCDPNSRGRHGDDTPLGVTILHSIAGSRDHVTADERLAFATMLLDAGARLDVRDDVLKSTPLGWACRWGRVELVRLYLARGADPVEADAEPWATPLARADKKGHQPIVELLQEHVR
jgi:hypothetical protein